MNFRGTILLTALAISFVIRNAEGQVPGNHFAWGSSNAVADHTAQMTDVFGLEIYQMQTNSSGVVSMVYCAAPVWSVRFTNMASMNNWLVSRLTSSATNIFTTTNVFLDQPFTLYAQATDWEDVYGLAYRNASFNLIRDGTNYTIPDFSSMTMHLWSTIPYRVTNINWASIEVYNSASNQVINALDSRFEVPSASIVDVQNQLLDLPTAYLVGTNPFRLSVVTGTNFQYRVYGAEGNQIAELPNTISLPVISQGTKSLHVTAGDVGRVLVLQGSTNLADWVDLTAPHTNYYSGFDPGFSYSEKLVSPGRFFRLKITTENP